jgi:hypothetical protein
MIYYPTTGVLIKKGLREIIKFVGDDELIKIRRRAVLIMKNCPRY